MSSRMQRKKEEKNKGILDAAEKLVAEKGMDYMTMKIVAKKADVATGTLYLYFKNKGSLLAAINARINNELNIYLKEKLDLYQTGIGKVMIMGQATIEFCMLNPQKWKAITELYQMKIKDPEDPHVQEFLAATEEMVHMMADSYKQGIKEGSIREDLDPITTSIYNRMAWSNAFTPTTEQIMLLKRNKISQEQYLKVAGDLIARSTRKISSKDLNTNKNLKI
jgi:AcrR family transcriptional regulator